VRCVELIGAAYASARRSGREQRLGFVAESAPAVHGGAHGLLR
jgi:hypothetical protein